MPVTVVVGGQFGSEGKGKVAHYLAKSMGASYAVRCGGSNSGHTVVDDNGKTWSFRHLPTAAVLPDVKLAICAGSYIDIDVLFREIDEVGVTPDRLKIDPDAVIISNKCKELEIESGIIGTIGSTGSGTGAAVIQRIQRNSSVQFSRDIEELRPFIANVSGVLRRHLDKNERIILEGTQGFGLSLLHSGYYPKVTSRCTTAAAVISEVGLSPFDVDDIALVIRAFPIRVAGDSGPLEDEITWDVISKEGNHSVPIIEHTTVTKKVRRVARFTPDIVIKAIEINRPTKIFLNHVDYFRCCEEKNQNLYDSFINNIEILIEARIDYVGLSPSIVSDRSFIG